MPRFLFLIGAAALAPGGSIAGEFDVACAKAGDERTIEVVTPGEVGASCDVRYGRGAGNVSVPYHADNSPDFCQTKAVELANTLKQSGYVCSPLTDQVAQAAPTPVAQAVLPPANPAPVSQAPAGQQPTEPAAVEVASAQPVANAAALIADAEVTPAAIAAAPAPTPVSGPVKIASSDADRETKMSEILTAPPVNPQADEEVEEAVRGPAQLTNGQLAEAPAKARAASPVGRLVGAPPAPRPQQAAIDPTPASVTQAPAAEQPKAENTVVALAPAEPKTPVEAAKAPALVETDAETATPPTAPVVSTAPPATKTSKGSDHRKPADVVVATLQAQAAAWNEGNLDAFMATYWKSDDLRFVSGGNITKGWSATMKRYRERYADETGLGHLGFDKMDVKLVTEDVAVVTGRFNHTKGGDASSGVFSLVMRQTNGVWRIVHDHTMVDAKPAP